MEGLDFGTLFGPLKDTVMDGVTAVVPLALLVGGAILALRVGWRTFRQFTGR